MAAGVWHAAVADNLETMVDFEKKIVQIKFDLGPSFELGRLLQEIYSLSGLAPAGLVGVCCSPPCKTYSRLDQTNNIYRDHHLPGHPVKQPGSTNYRPAMAEVAHHADNTVQNLLCQLPGLGLAGMAASSPFFGQTEYDFAKLEAIMGVFEALPEAPAPGPRPAPASSSSSSSGGTRGRTRSAAEATRRRLRPRH